MLFYQDTWPQEISQIEFEEFESEDPHFARVYSADPTLKDQAFQGGQKVVPRNSFQQQPLLHAERYYNQ